MYSAWYISCLFLFVLSPTIYTTIKNSEPNNVEILNLYVENYKYYHSECLDSKNYCLKANITGTFGPCLDCTHLRCTSKISVDFVGEKLIENTVIVVSSYDCGKKVLLGDVLKSKKDINTKEMTRVVFYHFMIPLIFVLIFEIIRYSNSKGKIVDILRDLCCISRLNNNNVNNPNQVHPFSVV